MDEYVFFEKPKEAEVYYTKNGYKVDTWKNKDEETGKETLVNRLASDEE